METVQVSSEKNIYSSNLLKKILKKKLSIGIIGLGYVGLPLALSFCEKNIKVLGFEKKKRVINLLNKGKSHIHHIESKPIEKALASKLFFATDDYSNIKNVDVIIICVPTPLSKDNTPDITYIENSLLSVKDYLKCGQLISLESTTYPGTTKEILKPFLEDKDFTVGEDFFLVYSPEREDPANSSFKSNQIPKIIGGDTKNCTKIGKKVYELINPNVLSMTSTKAAEMTKLLENVFRAVNIGLINELKEFTDAINMDIHEVINAAATKPFGYMPFYPGPGVGGHCIPIDPQYLLWKAKEKGLTMKFIKLADEINSSMPTYLIKRLEKNFKQKNILIKGSKVLILGISYKKNIDDCRESPSLIIINKLINLGVDVSYNDPFFEKLDYSGRFNFNLKSTTINIKNIQEKDCIILLTDHDDYNYDLISNNSKLIIDTRGRFKNKSNIIRA